MDERVQAASVRQPFECFRFDSSAYADMFPIAPRAHYYSEVLLVRSGTCRVIRNGVKHVLGPGDLIYIAPLIRHSVSSEDGNPVVFDVVKFNATWLKEIPSYLSDLRTVAADAAQVRLPIQMTAEETSAYHLDSIIAECIVETNRQAFAWDLHIRALIYLLITGIARFWINKRELFADRMGKQRDPILDIPAYVEEHISEPLRVEELASMCGLSYPWFAKRFHEYFGISCKQLIERVREEAVEQYLIYTDLDLSEISRRTGFTDCSHMVKDFRRATGMTPGQFRSTMKSNGRSPFSRFSSDRFPNHPPKG